MSLSLLPDVPDIAPLCVTLGEVPVVLRGAKIDEVTVAYRSEKAAASALTACRGVSKDVQITLS